ncbi:hypothetical protein MLD38_039726 [Melastoma candidum]|uniref:Uncharacterized protein n=1 Tax=Melastoma candidum TaxID=119954 RepID=A0ACB9L477_9MYRT|nr:hypothetical protein MLD38_039726 [Melastoma candidum]
MMLTAAVAAILCFISFQLTTATAGVVKEVEGGPEGVVWVVQLSDLHFSVHHPDRARDFASHAKRALSIIKPSLVLITGDLTDGKSEDLLTMKQDEAEWIEYRDVIDDVASRSGIDRSLFYDVRGNHDSFGVPIRGGPLDYYAKYSVNGRLGRNGTVNSVTLVTKDRKHLFVGFDSAMPVGVRGPTNLFGHPSDQLLYELDGELSQWDSKPSRSVTKLAFGHFPLSFSAATDSGKSLRDVFLRHSLSAYLCGHLHTKFGRNLKRHHQSNSRYSSINNEFFQLNIHNSPSTMTNSCSRGGPHFEEFWEWEMGDWRKSRALRILAIDDGHVSYLDTDLLPGFQETIVMPTFPLDSRFMSLSSVYYKYKCQHMVPSSYETIRALVFSATPIISVVARIYDREVGSMNLLVETPMTKREGDNFRGDLYSAPWNYKAFEDQSPDRYWIQVEAIDGNGKSSLSDLRPFSVEGLTAKVKWTWKEFFVMGCQWDALYYSILWSSLCFIIVILLLPITFRIITTNRVSYRSFIAHKCIGRFIAWILHEIWTIHALWFSIIGYVFFLLIFPWCSGQIFTDSGKGYMTYKGWAPEDFTSSGNHLYIARPDVMVVVLPHLILVVLPMILCVATFAAERGFYQECTYTSFEKKEDDYPQEKRSLTQNDQGSSIPRARTSKRWLRKFLFLICLGILWKHYKSCRALAKGYDMNPMVNFAWYCFSVPLLLVYAVYETRSISYAVTGR